jgi:hypothetical protein
MESSVFAGYTPILRLQQQLGPGRIINHIQHRAAFFKALKI